MATNTRVINLSNISADTGELPVTGLSSSPPLPAIGTSEQIVNMRMRMTANTAGAGTILTSVRWNDGQSDQSWDVSLNPTIDVTDPLNPIPNYTEVGMQIWCDASRNVTAQVQPLVAGGSVDVRILGEF